MLATISLRAFLIVVFVLALPVSLWLGMAGGPAAVAALERGGLAALKRTALDQSRLMALPTSRSQIASWSVFIARFR